ALEPIDAEAVVRRRDGDRGAGLSELHVALRAKAEGMADRKLVARDRGQKRLRAAEPFAIALAALLDFPGSLVRRCHGGSIASRRVPVETDQGGRRKTSAPWRLGNRRPRGFLRACGLLLRLHGDARIGLEERG